MDILKDPNFEDLTPEQLKEAAFLLPPANIYCRVVSYWLGEEAVRRENPASVSPKVEWFTQVRMSEPCLVLREIDEERLLRAHEALKEIDEELSRVLFTQAGWNKDRELAPSLFELTEEKA